MKNIKEPKVSVCIPTYGRARILPKVIGSVLSQTYRDIEIFVSDDASPDNTEEVVRSFTDRRIRYHRNNKNLGVRDNWNFAIKNARGEYVFKLDDDDYIHPAFLEKTVSMLEKHPNIGSVYTGFYYAKDYNGGWIEKVVDDTLKVEYMRGIDYVRGYLLHASIPKLHPSSVVFRYSVAEEAGFFDTAPNDLMFSLVLAAKADVGYIPEPLFFYVQHTDERASYNKKSAQLINFEPTRLVKEFFEIEFIKTNAELMEIKDSAMKKGRIARSILHLLMCRKGLTFGNYLDAALSLIRRDTKLLLSPLFLIGLFLTFVMPKKLLEKFSYIYKSNKIFTRVAKKIFKYGNSQWQSN